MTDMIISDDSSLIPLANELDRSIYALSNLSLKSKAIIVLGPQFSGSTIASEIIAEELERNLALEEDFSVHNEKEFMELVSNTPSNIVVQAPEMSHIINDIYEKLGTDVFFVWMKRPFDEIHMSEKRAGLKLRRSEIYNKYKQKYDLSGFSEYGLLMNSAELKTEVWLEFQKPSVKPFSFTLDYRLLQYHRLWIKETYET